MANLVDDGVVDDALGARGEAQRGVGFVHVRRGGRDVADDGGLGVAAKRRLQDARQLAVPVRDMTACNGCSATDVTSLGSVVVPASPYSADRQQPAATIFSDCMLSMEHHIATDRRTGNRGHP